MLGAIFPVKVSLSPGVTVFSAVVAVVFTYLALISDTYTSKYLRRRLRKARRLASLAKKEARATHNGDTTGPHTPLEIRTPSDPQDVEAQPLLCSNLLETESVAAESEAAGNLTDLKKSLNDTCKLRAMALDDERLERLTWSSTGGGSTHSTPLPRSAATDASEPVTPMNAPEPSPKPTEGRSRRPSLSFFSRKWSSGNKTVRSSANASSTDLTASSSDIDRHFSGDGSTTITSSGSGSFMRGLPLSKREKMRLKQGVDRSRSVKELLLTLWGDCTSEAIAKAGIWALAIVTMHYSGMAAFHVDKGFAVWSTPLILASAVIAWIVCLVGLLFSRSRSSV